MQFLFIIFFLFLLSAATKVLIAPVVILLVVVLGALALVIGNTIMNTHMHSKRLNDLTRHKLYIEG